MTADPTPQPTGPATTGGPDGGTAAAAAPRPTLGQPQPALPSAADLDAETHRLLDFARGSLVGADGRSGGFGYLSDTGEVLEGKPVETWVTCRMTYSFALGHLLGREADASLVDHGVEALSAGGVLRDDEHGGWYAAVTAGGDGAPLDTTKAAYAHAFVVLAAATATVAGRPGGRALLTEALGVVEDRFWDDEVGMVRESFTGDWSTSEDYRGVNANMHTVEAFLAAADALDLLEAGSGALWRTRAGRIVERVVHDIARTAGWRLPEHFTAAWEPLPDYNTDERAHPFRPYGVTPGHLLEWARLALHLRAAEALAGSPERDWLLPDAIALYDTAVADGWHADGLDGFVYTTDFDGAAVTRARMHWVLTEAIGAAAALFQATGDQRYQDDHVRFWEHARELYLDEEGGSWRHELDEQNRPAAGTWAGKPDVYHAVQATLVPRLPLAPTFGAALRAAAEA